MKGIRVPNGFSALICLVGLFGIQGVWADTLIFDNSNYTGYILTPPSYTEFLDYGLTNGGRISKFVFGYSSPSAVSVLVRFYDGTYRDDPGYEIRQFSMTVPGTGDFVSTLEYVIPEQDRFDLPAGYFGYSFEFSNSDSGIALATGGAGIKRYYWVYDEWIGDFMPADLGENWNFYFQVYTAPPINEVTCDIEGYKFNDSNANHVWDSQEPAMPGWELFLDINGDGAFQSTEPNAVTDPNGFYRFENLASPANYRVREIQKAGWTQTLPGSAENFQYVIKTDPNHVYGPYNFGNTTFVPKYSGGDGSAANPYKISAVADWELLTNTPADWSKNFILVNDIDLGGDSLPLVGTGTTPFTGTFEGNNYVFSNKSSGLFGILGSGGMIRNLGMENIQVVGGGPMAGTLCGINEGGTIRGCFVTGSSGRVSVFGAGGYTGGLCGHNRGSISECYTTIPVSGTGELYGFGGLCGKNEGTISRCYATGNISGFLYLGGLCGINEGTLQASYATGQVSSPWGWYIGGLCGQNLGQIQDCRATGGVEGYEDVGGLCGWNDGGTIHNGYAIGTVAGYSNLGGLCGKKNGGTIGDSFWDMKTSGRTTSSGGDGKTTVEMKTRATFADAGWDFTTIWRICDGTNYPRLQWEPRPVGDFGCPEGVELADLRVMAEDWMATGASVADLAPTPPDGKVNLQDFSVLAGQWMVGVD
ncbi:MAG: hypothetical protein GX455_16990 [Phycisphaerae bacterium]|nr:hypothetical protein [Phycisphaerae bacterium]